MSTERRDALIDGLIDGTLSEDDQAELDALITTDPAVARQVALMCDLTRELGERLRPSSQVLPIVDQPSAPRSPRAARAPGRRSTLRLRRPRSTTRLARYVALVTALAALIAVVVLVPRSTPRERWLEGHAELAHGGRLDSVLPLPAGTPITATGQAVLCYADGTRVRMARGTQVQLGQGPGKDLQVLTGLVEARVAKQPSGRPFRVWTAHAEMIVVGTVFTVAVDGPRTELAVTEGAVRLQSPSGDLLVTSGQRQVVGPPTAPEPPAAARPAERPERLIARRAVWAYRDDGVEPQAGWHLPGFDDRAWPRGPAPLGFDRNEERTVFATHLRSDNRSLITGWFRHEFTCEDPTQIARLVIRLQRDDGAVVYLNGREVVRDNMPDGPITPQTVAAHDAEKSHEEDAFVWPIPPTALRPGRNCITAEVHQYSAKSTDLLFSLELLPEYHPSGRTTP